MQEGKLVLIAGSYLSLREERVSRGLWEILLPDAGVDCAVSGLPLGVLSPFFPEDSPGNS